MITRLFWIAIAGAAMALGACSAAKVATTPVDVVTLQKAAYTYRAIYIGTLEVAANITDLPRCEKAPAPCVYQDTVNRIRAAQKIAGESTANAEKYAKELTVDPSALSVAVDLAKQNSGIFKSLVDSRQGVK